MKIKEVLLKLFPYAASIVAGLLFYLIGTRLSIGLKNLFVNISAAFLAIPFIYLFYRLAHNFSKKRLNKEIFDYAKMQIDREILSITNQLYKIVYTIEEKDFSTKGINKFISLDKINIKNILKDREYLGFQIFKNWEVSENNLHEILKNSYIFEKLEDEKIISIIKVIKYLRYLVKIQNIDDLYLKTNKKAKSYKVVSGTELNEKNIKYPDRFLLLKKLGDIKFLVSDFGDFPQYRVNKLLNIYKVNKENNYLEIYAESIYDLITQINRWLDLTDEEFVIDTKMFKLGYKMKMNMEKEH